MLLWPSISSCSHQICKDPYPNHHQITIFLGYYTYFFYHYCICHTWGTLLLLCNLYFRLWLKITKKCLIWISTLNILFISIPIYLFSKKIAIKKSRCSRFSYIKNFKMRLLKWLSTVCIFLEWSHVCVIFFFQMSQTGKRRNLYPPILGRDGTKVLRKRADYIMHQKNVNYGLWLRWLIEGASRKQRTRY